MTSVTMSTDKKEEAAAAAVSEDAPEGEVDPELLKEVEAKAKEMSDNCRVEMDAKLQVLQETLKTTVATTNTKMKDVAERYQNQSQDRVTNIQTDILRLNKVIRDVARELGTDWKAVFEMLMRSYPPEAVKVEVDIIEQQKPFMRGFKALATWRDAMGAQIQGSHLVEALNSVNRTDLADKAKAVLESSELDALYSMSNFGSGIKSGMAANGAPVPAGGATTTEGGETGSEPEARTNGARGRGKGARPVSVLMEDFTPDQGLLADTILLRVARKLDGEWEPLGKALGVPDPELAEIKENEGPTSVQGTFKMLFSWRNSLGVVSGMNVAVLRGALKKLGKAELAASITDGKKD